MALFLPALDATLAAEGGYLLHQVPGDRGGQTFAGIARTRHPDWPGWALIDQGERAGSLLRAHVADFYRHRFWARIQGDAIAEQAVAESLFDFAVNAGAGTAVRCAQQALGVAADGALGPVTLGALNAAEPGHFLTRFALAKLRRYAAICNNDRAQSKFLLGWLNRTLGALP